MQDLDSYQMFCALELLKSKHSIKTKINQEVADDEVICACAKYLEETL